MKKIKIMPIVLCASSLLLLISCSSKKIPASKGGYTYSGLYFGSYFTKDYKLGINDGCDTAKGTYTKKHKLFNHNNDYNKGWFLGRNRCKKLLKLDSNGDLIL